MFIMYAYVHSMYLCDYYIFIHTVHIYIIYYVQYVQVNLQKCINVQNLNMEK